MMPRGDPPTPQIFSLLLYKVMKVVYCEGWHSGPSLMPGRGIGKGPPRGFASHLHSYGWWWRTHVKWMMMMMMMIMMMMSMVIGDERHHVETMMKTVTLWTCRRDRQSRLGYHWNDQSQSCFTVQRNLPHSAGSSLVHVGPNKVVFTIYIGLEVFEATLGTKRSLEPPF